MPDHYWGSWFFGGELLSGNWPNHSGITHLPEGGSLWITDPIGGLLGLLLRPLGYPAAWNSSLFLQVLAACWAGYWLGWTQLGERLPAFLVGLACGLSPYALGLLHSGLSEYVGLCWPPLFLGSLLLAYKRGSGALAPGIFLFLATLQAFYYGPFGLLLAACLLVGAGATFRLRVFIRMTAIWATLSTPLVFLAQRSLRAEDALITPENAPGWQPTSLPVIDLMSWFRPGDWVHPPTPELGNPGILHVNSLGLLLIFLLFLGWRRSAALRPLRWGSAIFGAFSLGPRLSWGGSATGILLPMALLYMLPFSIFDAVHHPYRIAAFLMPLVALWAAAGLASLPRRVQWLLPGLVLSEWLFFTPTPWPIASTPLPDVTLHFQAPEGAILDFPPDLSRANRRYTMAQVEHQHPIAFGVNRFLSTELKTDPLVGDLLRCMDHAQRLARNRDIPAREPVLLPPRNGESTLVDLGFNSIVIHKDFLSPKEERCVEAIMTGSATLLTEKSSHALWKTR